MKFKVNVPFELSRTSRIAGLAACLSVTSVATLAQQPQTPPPAAQPAAKPAAPATPSGQPATPAYSYDPQGRRDPFLSLLGRGEDTRTPTVRPSGLAGLLIGEITVKGAFRDKNGFIAVLQAPDNKSYIARVGDKLMDGTVKSIALDKVVFSQDVNDPLSLVKQRDVPKVVRQAEGRGE
jgi:type IV pilus assembly protein PilP